MKYLTYRDIPLLSQWQAGFSGTTWFSKDKGGTEWQVRESEDNDYLLFSNPAQATRTMSRQEFEERFNVKESTTNPDCCGQSCGYHG